MRKYLSRILTGKKTKHNSYQRDKVEAQFVVKIDSVNVGILSYDGNRWEFTYTEDFRNNGKFQPIVNFPDVDKTYKSFALWPFFNIRIPSEAQSRRQEYANEYQRIHHKSPDEVDLLREFGKRTIANPFILSPL